MAIVHKPIADAVEDVAERLSISIATAKVKLIEACENGLIQAYWRGHYSGQSPLIERAEWAGADIDVKRQVVIGASERMAFVDLDEKDYAAWLGAQTLPASPIVTKKSAGQGKKSRKQYPRARAEQALAALFNGEVPTVEALPNSALCAQVIAWIKADCDKRQLKFVAISDDTIERAAGRRK
jgi:hypothetical protein